MSEAAILGSIPVDVCALVGLLRQFYEDRDKLLTDMLGVDYGHSRRTEEMLRTVIAEFCRDRTVSIADYQMQLREFGGNRAIRQEIDRLADVGAIVLQQDLDDRRALKIWPTSKLTGFYIDRLPKLANNIFDEISKIKLHPKS